MTLEQFIAALRTRSFAGAASVGFASAYISTLGVSPKGLAAQLGVTPERIAQAVKDAGNKLVWTDPGAGITAGALKQTDGGIALFGESKESDGDRKAMGDSAIMRFENILTTKATDRDGDDLDPKGADVDPKAPLLWQHLPDAPIGKLYSVTERNGDFVKTACGIADTVLGRDAAILAEFGALRISHGFKPLEFSPKGHKADGEDGWNITKYHVMEVSLVSIPSNTGAVITALSRGKLHSPAIKGYAAALDAARPKIIGGGWDKSAADAGLPQGVTVNIHNHPAAAAGTKSGTKPPKGKDGESDADATTDDADDEPTPGDDAGDKDAPAMFREVLDAVKAMAKNKALPEEARSRAGLVYSMLKEASIKVAEYLKTAGDAGKNMDIAGFAAAAAGLVADCHTALTRAADEMGRLGEVAGIDDASLKSIGATRDAVATIVAALDDLVGASSDPDAAAAAGDDGTPPPAPVDDDEDGDGNPPPAEGETEEGADETEEDETEEENAADADYNADVSGESTDGTDAPPDTSDENTDDEETDEKGSHTCRDCGRSMTADEMDRPNVRCPNCGGHIFRESKAEDDEDTEEKEDDDAETADDDAEGKGVSNRPYLCGVCYYGLDSNASGTRCPNCGPVGGIIANPNYGKAAEDEDTEEKDGEVNDGEANPAVDDEPNPGMSDADKAAAKSLAHLFGEPGVVYDRATLDMLRDLTADAAP